MAFFGLDTKMVAKTTLEFTPNDNFEFVAADLTNIHVHRDGGVKVPMTLRQLLALEIGEPVKLHFFSPTGVDAKREAASIGKILGDAGMDVVVDRGVDLSSSAVIMTTYRNLAERIRANEDFISTLGHRPLLTEETVFGTPAPSFGLR